MAGHKLPPDDVRLATNRLLWRLNQLGRLRLVDIEGEPITNAAAKAAVSEDQAARGIGRYPKMGEPIPDRRYPVGSSPVAGQDVEAA